MRKPRAKASLVGTVIVLPFLLLVFQSQVALAEAAPLVSCAAILDGVGTPISHDTPQARAWADSIGALKQIQQRVYGRDQVIEALTTAILANEFVWINGEPGGAKTYLSRLMFQSVLNSIPEKDKRVFVLQFHKLISEGKITGFQKFSSMMKEGKYEIETDSSLVGDKFLFLIADEAEKSNPAVLNALLSVLNERKAFLGSRVVDAILSSGVFTSNKTTGEFIQSFLNDRASGEALLDRMAIEIHIPNQQLSPKETIAMYDLVKNPDHMKISLPLNALEPLVANVKIPKDMMAEIVSIAREFDRYVTSKADKSKASVRYGEVDSEYFPANQFSNRSVRRLVQVFKAALIARQLMTGVPYNKVRLTPTRQDLSLLAQSALYSGPGGLKLKTFEVTEAQDGIRVTSPFGTSTKMAVQYSPYSGELLLQDGGGNTQFVFAQNPQSATGWSLESKSQDFKDWSVDPSGFQSLAPKIRTVTQANNIDLSRPQFEVDQSIEQLLSRGIQKKRTRNELSSIRQDLEQFANILNQHFESGQSASQPQPTKLLPARSAKEIRQFRREVLDAQTEERVSSYYDWMDYEVQAISQRFVELDYAVEAHLTGILSHNHLYVFGPPGGAKTQLAEVILRAELKKLNADEVDAFVKSTLEAVGPDQNFLRAVVARMRAGESPETFDRFLLQFHKLLPEGVLIGFPKVEKQLNEGIEEMEVSTSLANQKFIFAILDEVDKANPQTITALLSILNEREVFAGNQVIKTALRSAILTSNKMPSEFLDSYNEDRQTGEAVMDRTINKVYVSNKISSDEGLTQFLINLENGISPSWDGLLAVGELEPIVKEVDFENPALKEMLAQVFQKFLALRIQKSEETRKAHLMDPREFPDYYVPATDSASDRTFIKLIDQLKARFIVHQLMQGVEFKNLRTTIEMKDLGLFFEGLAYWGPQTIVASYNQDGILQFTNHSEIIERLIASGLVGSRVKFHLNMMLEEAKEYTQVLNESVRDFMQEYNLEITNYPDLFSTLFLNRQSQPSQQSSQSQNLITSASDALHTTIETEGAVAQAIHNLASLRLSLDLAKATGASSIKLTALTADYKKKGKELAEYLEKNKIMTTAELADRMRQEIAVLQSQRQTRVAENTRARDEENRHRRAQEEQMRQANIDGSRLVFHTIRPGSFKMGEVGHQVDVTITKGFRLAATPTTEIVYKEIAELANARFPQKYHIYPDPSVYRGDLYPVENVSWDDTQTWINALNDLSQAGEPRLAELIPEWRQGKHYRLDTEAQFEFVVRGRGAWTGEYPAGITAQNLSQFAKFGSSDGTENVTARQPIVVDGMPFYALLGNVWEWKQDAWDGSSPLPGGTDPVGTSGSYRSVRGGSYNINAGYLRAGFRSGDVPGGRDGDLGFRLLEDISP